MSTIRRSRLVAVISVSVLTLTVRPAAADRDEGVLLGWVEDTQGTPVSGAVISLFGKGLGRGLVTFSDSAGRFALPALPAGSYTLRALGHGHVPAPARQVTVLPNQDSIFSVSLTPLGVLDERESEERTRELRWLLRHRQRSVLESQAPVVVAARQPEGDLLAHGAPWLTDLAGSVEVVANPAAFGVGADALKDEGSPASRSVVRLNGRLAGLGSWSLGGLVAESESATWRMAAEFLVEPGGGHAIRAGAGYGSQKLRPALVTADLRPDDSGVGAMFLEDRWDAGPIAATVGGRYSFIGYLRDSNHLDPSASLELQQGGGTKIRGTFATRTLLPGGDLLTLSSLGSGPTISLAVLEQGLRPERTVRCELAVDRSLGSATLGALTFYEGVHDQLVNSFEGPRSARMLHIFNAPGLAARGMGLTVTRRFGSAVKGSVTYTYGRTWRQTPPLLSPGSDDLPGVFLHEGDFHDMVGRLETVIDRSDTHLVAFYRLNTLSLDTEGLPAIVNSRFDLQLRQGLPLLHDLTRGEWELLLAYRNLFYETSDGGTLDEVVVSNPPKRFLGGISVRF